ncbi:hypothetical protein K435DRAFT_973415 [Dendrothele bispora CBS 962.96]|uniref:Transcription factor IIIC 90kDa subunit N-terminal domain-containing protein n=1 Tax=Dendrothele bispora (strain CBS 962.96) TaxID=1314807 RepID=A0A4S8KSV4_DENBC|nr:hypothetical protein K435DRAFT_973415 [Dendrothele bispora CBS 962.96]
MDSHVVYTALNVPTVITSPSVKCLQWSPDGQACLASKSAIYVMTPDHGINFDAESILKASPDANREDRPLVGWFRTMIQFDKTEVCRWPDYSQEFGAGSLGSIDITVWSMVFSPSNVTPDAGCVMATLSTNMDLTLWTAGKNALKGEWIKNFDVTPFLIENFIKDESKTRTENTLTAQIICIAWSPQADFGLKPTPTTLNASVLVGGNRAGSLVFMRYNRDSTLEVLQVLNVSDKWITHVAFSRWELVEEHTCMALVAYGTSDGVVDIVKVKQRVQRAEGTGFAFNIVTTIEPGNSSIGETRRAGLTALEWVDIPERKPVLVYCKPGTVHLWSAPPETTPRWSGDLTIPLKTQKHSVGSSCFHPVTGLQYIARRDKLIISLLDGSFHVVHDLSTSPNITAVAEEDSESDALTLTSKQLSSTVRSVFSRVEQETITFSDVNRMSGMVSYEDAGVLGWVHEAVRPADFSYKHDAKHNSMLIVAQIWNDLDDEVFIQQLSDTLLNAKAAVGIGPLQILRFTFFHLREKALLNRLHHQLLEVLGKASEDYSASIVTPTWGQGPLSPGVRAEVRSSLASHLFGWDNLLSLRMRLSLADFAWKLSEKNTERQEECGRTAHSLLTTISHRNLRTIIRHLVAVSDKFALDDIPFVRRMVVQSLLEGSPPDLSSEGQSLSEVVSKMFEAEAQSSDYQNLNEVCPACQVEVRLDNITNATCTNGHTWSRCSVTTFILSTPRVRTCIGCTRKAFLPPSSISGHSVEDRISFMPPGARGWFVEDLLEAVHRCLFCGNSFVSVL